MKSKFDQGLHVLAVLTLLSLIVLCVGWELWWAPLREQGSLLALKAVPLLFATAGVLKGRVYTFQWLSLLSLLYVMEGIVRAWSDVSVVSARLALAEAILSSTLYFVALLTVRRAARCVRHG